MIWNVAALSLILASAGADKNLSPNVKISKLEKLMKKRHERNVRKLTALVEAAPKQLLSADTDMRVLLDNPAVINYAYSSDETCGQAPFAYAGVGTGTCIPSAGGGAKMFSCTGPSSALNVTIWTWDSADDCTGSASSSQNIGIDGTCIDDGEAAIDDRFQDDIIEDAGSYAISCDSNKQTNTLAETSSWGDDNCKNWLNSYYGINKNRCLQLEEFNDKYVIISGSDCEDGTLYNDDECTELTTLDDDFWGSFDDDDDDYDDDDYDDDDYDDDEGINPNQCYDVSQFDDDDVPTPGDVGGMYIKFYDGCDGGDDDDDDVCFSGSETVLLESGASKAMSEVEVGDVVQVVAADGSLQFSEVVFLPHGSNSKKTSFTELQMASGKSLRATAGHFVMAGECGSNAFTLTAAGDIEKGACVSTVDGEDVVSGSSIVVDHGVYTIVTKETSGLVVVNGVHASSFGYNHWLVNNYYNIHRTVYNYAPSLLKNRNVVAANLIVGDIALSL